MSNNRRTLSRRTLLRAGAGTLAATAVGPTLAGCGGSSKIMKVWSVASFTKQGDNEVGDQVQKWASDNHIRVQFSVIPSTNYIQKVGAAIQAKAIPDVVMLESTDPIYYGSQGHLADLTDVLDSVKGQAGGMFSALNQYAQVGGKTYGIPMESDVSGLYARLDLMEQATGKREAPATLDELESAARKAQRPPNLYGIGIALGKTADSDGNITSVINADGGSMVDKDGNPAINSDGTISALERIQRWWKDKLIPPDALTADDAWNNQLFQSKQAMFVFNGASIYGAIAASDKALLKNITQAPFPAGRAGSAQGVGTWLWSVSKTSRNLAKAKDLVKYLMKPDNIEKVYEKVGGRWYPVYQDLTKEKYWTDQPVFSSFPQIIEKGRPTWFPAQASPHLLRNLSSVSQQNIATTMVQDILLKHKTPAQAAKSAQDSMERIFGS